MAKGPGAAEASGVAEGPMVAKGPMVAEGPGVAKGPTSHPPSCGASVPRLISNHSPRAAFPPPPPAVPRSPASAPFSIPSLVVPSGRRCQVPSSVCHQDVLGQRLVVRI